MAEEITPARTDDGDQSASDMRRTMPHASYAEVVALAVLIREVIEATAPDARPERRALLNQLRAQSTSTLARLMREPDDQSRAISIIEMAVPAR